MSTLKTVFISNPPSTSDPEAMLAWVQDMAREVTEHLSAIQQSFHELTYIEPEKQEEGMIRKADGTTWNPGLGAGLYQYQNGIWQSLGSKVLAFPINNILSGATASVTITSAHAGDLLSFNPDTNAVLTANLPAVSTLRNGLAYHFHNVDPSGDVKLVPDGSDTINGTTGDWYVAGDEKIILVPDPTSGTNWLSIGTRPGIRQILRQIFVTQISSVSTTYVSTGFTASLSEKLQSLASRERVRVYGVISSDAAANRIIDLTLHDGSGTVHDAGVRGIQSHVSKDSVVLNTFAFEWQQTGLRSSETPTTWDLQWKVDAGTAWMNRPGASSVPKAEIIMEIEELSVA